MCFEDHYIVHGVPKPLEPGLTCALFTLKSRKHGTQDYSTTALICVTFLPVVINFVPRGK